MSNRIILGSYLNKITDNLEEGETIQFVDLPGSPRVAVTADGRLEISYDSGQGEVAVSPRAGNVIQVRLVV